MGFAIAMLVLLTLATLLATFPTFWLRIVRAWLERMGRTEADS